MFVNEVGEGEGEGKVGVGGGMLYTHEGTYIKIVQQKLNNNL